MLLRYNQTQLPGVAEEEFEPVCRRQYNSKTAFVLQRWMYMQ